MQETPKMPQDASQGCAAAGKRKRLFKNALMRKAGSGVTCSGEALALRDSFQGVSGAVARGHTARLAGPRRRWPVFQRVGLRTVELPIDSVPRGVLGLPLRSRPS